MRKYNPEQAPNAAEWLALDEQERILLIQSYHRKARIEIPNVQLHAIVHAIVENQIAEAHEPAVRAMARLTAEGLTRHDALHAIASVLAERLFEVFQDGPESLNAMDGYDAAVEHLTAVEWRRS